MGRVMIGNNAEEMKILIINISLEHKIKPLRMLEVDIFTLPKVKNHAMMTKG